MITAITIFMAVVGVAYTHCENVSCAGYIRQLC